MRDNIVPVRFTDAELEVLDRRVARSGLTRSALVRQAYLENPDTVFEARKTSRKPVGR